MPDRPPEDALTSLLRAGDPANGDPGLDPTERTLMRQRILATGRERRHRAAGWLLPATTAIALLALALGLALRQPRVSLPGGLPGTGRPTLAATSTEALTSQQIQFTTDNNTLVVWVLQPRSAS